MKFHQAESLKPSWSLFSVKKPLTLFSWAAFPGSATAERHFLVVRCRFVGQTLERLLYKTEQWILCLISQSVDVLGSVRFTAVTETKRD